MKMTQEMLEIMMGEHLDGEISPSEQRLLEAELDRNPQARELLGQLRQVHERCGEAVASELLGRGRTPEEIFQLAWQQPSKRRFRPMMKMRVHFRFAAGLAAGLLIGLGLHFVLPIISTPGGDSSGRSIVAQDTESAADVEQQIFERLSADPASQMILNVDWYNFTDKHGNKWLIEGLRENTVRPAAYYGDL